MDFGLFIFTVGSRLVEVVWIHYWHQIHGYQVQISIRVILLFSCT